MIGTILNDRWRIVAELGRGGMGEVYLAEHLELGRQEALKILMPSIAADPQFVSRFRREARAVNRLRHPNIVSLYDFGQLDDGRFYLSMEYAAGESVFRLMRKHQVIPPARALYLLSQLAYALHHAHSRGVVHRDLKPGNIMVTEDDVVKVLDFGMAKITAPDFLETTPLSVGNVIWGTAKYMAPERATGIATNDPRSDLYAIGCLAYELLVGQTPFTGSPQEVIQAHLSQNAIAPSAMRPEQAIAPELDAVVLRCLAKQPGDRYQNAAELYAALRKVPGYPAPKAETRRRFVPIEKSPDQLPTTPRARTEPGGNSRGALCEIAEALLDHGVDDTRLVAGVAHLRDHERSLARLEGAQDALEHEAAAVRETAGDREISLRFALGELQFAAKTSDPGDAEKIHELETRLAAAVAEGDRLRALEQGIESITALRSDAREKVKTAYTGLEMVVDELVAAHENRADLAEVRERLAAVRARRRTPA
jgi:serine/threonine protein kinase